MKKISAVCILFLVFGGFLCAQSGESLPSGTEEPDNSASAMNDAPVAAVSFRQEGIASWYGAEFAGRATASGEIFDPAQLTAAHADLPFGTYLIVTNIENGKKIAVRVNDRGPFVRSRILDVSRAAAERLDMLAAGTARVVIEAATREAAQTLVRELGVSAAPVTRPAATAAPRTAVPSTAAQTPSTPQRPDSSSIATPPAVSGAATPASPVNTAPAPAPAPAPSATSSRAPATAPAAAGTPVMSPTGPRTPSQSATTAVVPSPSVSRVTGRVENIPEIRRSSEPGYVVVDEQVVTTTPPAYTPSATAQADATPRTTTPAVSPAATPGTPAAAATSPTAAPRTTAPAAASSTPQTAVPAVEPIAPANAVTPANTAPASPARVPAAAPASQPAVATPARATAPVVERPDVTARPNPAASVPVTNPEPAGKLTFTGSLMVQGKNYRVQVGSFAELKNASHIFNKLYEAGLNPSFEPYDGKYYRVVIMNVKAEDADDLSQKLATIGITEALAREDVSR